MTQPVQTPSQTRQSAVRRIKSAAAEALEAPRARAAELGGDLRQAAATSRVRSAQGVQAAVAQARKRPVSTGVLVLGAIAGGALMLHPVGRRLALASAPRVWRAFQGWTARRS
jgi:hypothetical protein